jgi:PAS domain S-box-containing protein
MWNDDWRWTDAKNPTERQTRRVVHTAHDVFISLDAAGLITDWNSQAEVSFGWARDEVLGRDLAATVISEGHREADSSGIERFLAAGQDPAVTKSLDLMARHRDGREFPIELAITPHETEEGHAFDAFVRERPLAEAPAASAFGSWEWDIAAGTIEWSEELCHIYGIQPGGQLSFEEFLALIHPDDRARMQATVQTAYETWQPFSLQHRIVRPDGVVRVLQGRGQVITDDEGRALRMFGTGQDITEGGRSH